MSFTFVLRYLLITVHNLLYYWGISRDSGEQLKTIANGLRIYRPDFKKIVDDEQNKIRNYRLGQKNPMKQMKYIMMVGMTGAGKSLQINNLINYILGVSYDDDFRFKLILEEEELRDRRPNQSQYVSGTLI